MGGGLEHLRQVARQRGKGVEAGGGRTVAHPKGPGGLRRADADGLHTPMAHQATTCQQEHRYPTQSASRAANIQEHLNRGAYGPLLAAGILGFYTRGIRRGKPQHYIRAGSTQCRLCGVRKDTLGLCMVSGRDLHFGAASAWAAAKSAASHRASLRGCSCFSYARGPATD